MATNTQIQEVLTRLLAAEPLVRTAKHSLPVCRAALATHRIVTDSPVKFADLYEVAGFGDLVVATDMPGLCEGEQLQYLAVSDAGRRFVLAELCDDCDEPLEPGYTCECREGYDTDPGPTLAERAVAAMIAGMRLS